MSDIEESEDIFRPIGPMPYPVSIESAENCISFLEAFLSGCKNRYKILKGLSTHNPELQEEIQFYIDNDIQDVLAIRHVINIIKSDIDRQAEYMRKIINTYKKR